MPGIILQELTKVYLSGPRPVTAVDHVSLAIEPGELYFLLGPSGCGKTTLLRMIAGLIAPTSGTIRFGDRDVTALPTEQRHTALVFQNYALWPHLTVQQNVEFGPKMRRLGATECRRRATDNLASVQLAQFAARKPNQLSGGQQQRVALARALAAEPEVLLLDEPLSNLDAQLRLHMRDELRRLVKERQATAVYVTHDQKEALSMADRVAVLNEGRVIQVGTPQQLYEQPATRFIAEFLGEANLISGRLERGPAGPAVHTAAGVIHLADDRDWAAGSTAWCCLRPERISLTAGTRDDDTPAALLQGRVEHTVYLGETRQYHVRLRSGEFWKVTVVADRSAPLPTGAEVALQYDPAHVTLVEA